MEEKERRYFNWRPYAYLFVGLAYGGYRYMKVEIWSTWDYFDVSIGAAMVLLGIYSFINAYR